MPPNWRNTLNSALFTVQFQVSVMASALIEIESLATPTVRGMSRLFEILRPRGGSAAVNTEIAEFPAAALRGGFAHKNAEAAVPIEI